MKVTRKRFDYFKSRLKDKNKKRLILIGIDRYIYIQSFKRYIKSIYNVIEGVLMLPIGLITAIASTLWECVMDLPEYFTELWHRIADLVPIKYIKVINDEEVESIK